MIQLLCLLADVPFAYHSIHVQLLYTYCTCRLAMCYSLHGVWYLVFVRHLFIEQLAWAPSRPYKSWCNIRQTCKRRHWLVYQRCNLVTELTCLHILHVLCTLLLSELYVLFSLRATPLHRAAGMGSLEAVQKLMQHSANLQAKTLIGTFSICLFCLHCKASCVITTLYNRNILLLEWYAVRATSLHRAAGMGSLEAVQKLMQHSANLQAKTLIGECTSHSSEIWQRCDVKYWSCSWYLAVHLTV